MSAGASKIVNAVLYELGWACCVFGAAWGYPLLGGGLALLLVLVHLWLAQERRTEVRLIALAIALGILVDSSQQAFGLLSFKPDALGLWLPLWVFVIWAQFATLFHYALSWLVDRPLVAMLFGLVGGPLAYGGGIRLGAAEFGPNPTLSLIVLAVIWSLVVPLMAWLSTRIGYPSGQYRGVFERSNYA
ncbi:Protein of unknown function [Malonomonas rubra DSM 5091]|uniref:DUF2878 domain-containing protein n=1 Tax=Malonomonas rubra DSM 5091 TaxID=1122189 RepID=A0A1M6G2I4_MALRU|nr:DUF2878 domain-containing protein [Malonomonas rubra]SHJ04120.1 Protein of unknown function [Malonomonas rubra DSM 5091]